MNTSVVGSINSQINNTVDVYGEIETSYNVIDELFRYLELDLIDLYQIQSKITKLPTEEECYKNQQRIDKFYKYVEKFQAKVLSSKPFLHKTEFEDVQEWSQDVKEMVEIIQGLEEKNAIGLSLTTHQRPISKIYQQMIIPEMEINRSSSMTSKPIIMERSDEVQKDPLTFKEIKKVKSEIKDSKFDSLCKALKQGKQYNAIGKLIKIIPSKYLESIVKLELNRQILSRKFQLEKQFDLQIDRQFDLSNEEQFNLNEDLQRIFIPKDDNKLRDDDIFEKFE